MRPRARTTSSTSRSHAPSRARRSPPRSGGAGCGARRRWAAPEEGELPRGVAASVEPGLPRGDDVASVVARRARRLPQARAGATHRAGAARPGAAHAVGARLQRVRRRRAGRVLPPLVLRRLPVRAGLGRDGRALQRAPHPRRRRAQPRVARADDRRDRRRDPRDHAHHRGLVARVLGAAPRVPPAPSDDDDARRRQGRHRRLAVGPGARVDRHAVRPGVRSPRPTIDVPGAGPAAVEPDAGVSSP